MVAQSKKRAELYGHLQGIPHNHAGISLDS